MMLGRRADLRLVAKHLLGERRLADPGQLDRALDVGQLVDRRVEADERIGRKAGCPCPAFRARAGRRSFRAMRPRAALSSGVDRPRAAGTPARRARPNSRPPARSSRCWASAATCWKAREAAFAIAEPPRGEAGDPRGLRRPFAGRARPPGVGDAAGVHVEPEHIIDEGDAVAGFGAGFDRQLRRVGQQLRFGAGGVVGLDQRIERGAQLVGGGLALDRPGAVAARAPSRGSPSAVSATISGAVGRAAARSPCARAGRPAAAPAPRRSAPGARRGRPPASPWRCTARPWRRGVRMLGGSAAIPACADAQLPASIASNTPRQSLGTDHGGDAGGAGRRRLSGGPAGVTGAGGGSRRGRRLGCGSGASGSARLRERRRGPDQCSEREQACLQASSSISSSKSCHAKRLV